MALRVATKGWNVAADVLIDEGVRSSELIVHGGNDLTLEDAYARRGRHEHVTLVIFFLNITKVGRRACCYTSLVVVDIPEGVESIGFMAFDHCHSLTTVSFPTTLKSIGGLAFGYCTSLENVDLFHTNLQELGYRAFMNCSNLTSMFIPDSLQTLGEWVFAECPFQHHRQRLAQ